LRRPAGGMQASPGTPARQRLSIPSLHHNDALMTFFYLGGLTLRDNFGAPAKVWTSPGRCNTGLAADVSGSRGQTTLGTKLRHEHSYAIGKHGNG